MAEQLAEKPGAYATDDNAAGAVRFTLDGQAVTARPGETIWEVAQRHGTTIPHLCHRPQQPGYRPDGNCRACMVEIEGERVLAPSCRRAPAEGMAVRAASPRAEQARRMVLELLVADQPAREDSRDPHASFWEMAEATGATTSRFPANAPRPEPDRSHVAMQVALDACISCNLCVRACREVQVNDVIGMGGRNVMALPIFDFDDPMGQSTCVACGECVQACPTGALLPASLVAEDGQAHREGLTATRSICPFCGVGCQVELLSRDGKVVAVEGLNGPANEGRLCVKGRFGFDYIHHPHRLTVPLIRREGAPKEMGVDPANPLSHFCEASWDEALAAAADGLKRLRADHGGTAVAGFGSAKCTNEEAYLFQKLIRQGFRHNNVDHCTRLCHASSVAALMENVGSAAVTATFNEIENADCAIVIGANPVENHPVAATYFKQFAKNGGTLIVMDPRGQALRKQATHMLQFRPAGDVSMLNAIMHVIVEEGLADRQYIEAMTENWDAMREHLAAYTPEAMEPICGIPAETLRQVARAFARARAGMIFWGMGVSQHVHGTDNSRCLISLALMCGHVGRPGTGLHPLRGQNNVQGASDAGLIPMFLPDYRDVTDAEFRRIAQAAWGADETPSGEVAQAAEGEEFLGKRGLTVTEILDAIHDGLVKGMVIQGENPAMSDPDLNHAREALRKLEHLVVADIFLTETAMYADVVLPAAAFYEKLGTVTNTNRQVQIGRPAVPPPGQARADWIITRDLGRAIGLPWTYEHPRELYAEMASVMPSLDNITWERLEAEASVIYPSLSPTDPGQPVVFGDGFPRESGRARFAPAAIVPPDEQPDDDYPMVLTTGRQLEHWHTGSMTRRSNVLDTVEPQANCSLHPATLRRIGVAPGGLVRLETRRGAIELMARADRGVAEDMVFVPFAYVEAAANLLTNPALDPYGKIPEYKYAAVRVSAAG